MQPKRRRGLAALFFLLAGAAGGVDAVGWLTLGHLFTAHMSGNTVGMTAHVALGDWGEAGRRAFTIGAFLLGLALGATAATVAHRLESRASFCVALAFEAALLVALAVGGGAAMGGGGDVPRQPAASYWALVAAAAMAMGVQSATLRRVGDARARTTYVTGILTRLVEAAVELAFRAWDRARGRPDAAKEAAARRKLALLAGLWTAYACGGVASALLERAIGVRAVVLPLLAVVLSIGLDWRLVQSGVEGAGPEEG